MKVAVYSSVVGGYDKLTYHELDPSVDYYMFSDFVGATPYGWKFVPVSGAGLSPAITSRRVKCNPHASEILRGYDVTVWIDGNFSIISKTFVSEVVDLLENEILLARHPHRECVYEEMDECRYIPGVVRQRKAYLDRHYPAGNGLYCGGLIVRDMSSLKVRGLGDMWWDHVCKYSARDQISLPYCLWAFGIEPDILPKLFWNEGDLPHFDWFEFGKHLK